MSSTKRRKLSVPSDPPQLSAFAARRRLQEGQTPKRIGPASSQRLNITIKSPSSRPAEPSVSSADVAGPNIHDTSVGIEDPDTAEPKSDTNGRTSEFDDDDHNYTSESRADSPEVFLQRQSIPLSTLKPSKDNIKYLRDGTLSLRLGPGERLIVLGEYEISVQKGQVTVLGATIQASKVLYRIYAPSSHSLPVIRCLATEFEHAEIRLHQCNGGLRVLKDLSPLFGKLWNDTSGPLGLQHQSILRHKMKSTFQILFSLEDRPQTAYLQPIVSPPGWNELFSNLSGSIGQKPSTIMICGPKSSGKSTFATLLTNRLLSTAVDSMKRHTTFSKFFGVALLDLDPGQPEYSPPGQLSLVHIMEPNFGVPYSHPIPDKKNKIIRAHTIGAIKPSLDPGLYTLCALDLFAHYSNLLSFAPNCPLVINTPGWVLGTGLEILMDLISKIRPTEIIYMSQDGPVEVVESLRGAAKTTPLFTLPSQVSEYITRTAAHVRTMQTMSYFHFYATLEGNMAWNSLPLTSVPPWEIKYSGENTGILGVMCYGEQPPADLLFDLINGSVVAVVVIEDKAAIQGWQREGEDRIEEGELESGSKSYDIDTDDTEIGSLYDKDLLPRRLVRPLIVHTPHEDLPYFNPENIMSLHPKYSHTIGLALVRGIDVSRRCLQVITPIARGVIEEVVKAGSSIVLVSGKFDTPRWAYVEELVKKSTHDKAAKKDSTAVDEDEDEDENEFEEEAEDGEWVRDEAGARRFDGEGFENAPWIERLEGSEGRGVGARVWRVRRDLGRSGDGGD